MESSEKASLVLFLTGLCITGGLAVHYFFSVLPQYDYLDETEKWLKVAQNPVEIEEKLQYIAQAYEVYQTGVSQQNDDVFRVMLRCTEIEDVDYLLPKAISWLEGERESREVSFKGIITFVLNALFLATTAYGTSEYSNWDENEQHGYNIIVGSLLTGLLVSLL